MWTNVWVQQLRSYPSCSLEECPRGKWMIHRYSQPKLKTKPRDSSLSVYMDSMVLGSDQFPMKHHVFQRLWYCSGSGDWEDGSETDVYMIWLCPVASNNPIPYILITPIPPPWGFTVCWIVASVRDLNSEAWDGMKPYPHKPWGGHFDFKNSSNNKSGLSQF